MADDLDWNAAEALKFLLESTPTAMTTGFEDWAWEEVNGRNVLFYKERITYHETLNYKGTF